MATECENKLIITCGYEDGEPEEQFWQFVAKSMGGTIDQGKVEFPLLANTYPAPTFESDDDAGDWAAKHWGTSAEVIDAAYDDLARDNDFLLYFTSYDTPPLKWLEKMTAEFPNLLFKLQYCIPEGEDIGVAVAAQGKLKHVQINFIEFLSA